MRNSVKSLLFSESIFVAKVTGFLWTMLATLSLRRFISIRKEGSFWIHKDKEGVILVDLSPSRMPGVSNGKALPLFVYNYMPRAGDLVVDVGCGNGESLLSFSSLVSEGGRAIGIEANPEVGDCARLLIDLNRARNAAVLTVGVGKASTSGRLKKEGESHAGYQVVIEGESEDATGVHSIEVDTLTNVLLAQGITAVDYMKINIEGMELQAIEGIDPSRLSVKHLCVSCHDFLGGQWLGNFERVKSTLEKRGYKVSSHPSVPGLPWAEFYVYAKIS